MTADTRWLDDDEQRAWRAFLTAQRLLFDRLERQRQRDAGLPQRPVRCLGEADEDLVVGVRQGRGRRRR